MARPNGPARQGWVHSVSSGDDLSRAKRRRIPCGYLRSAHFASRARRGARSAAPLWPSALKNSGVCLASDYWREHYPCVCKIPATSFGWCETSETHCPNPPCWFTAFTHSAKNSRFGFVPPASCRLFSLAFLRLHWPCSAEFRPRLNLIAVLPLAPITRPIARHVMANWFLLPRQATSTRSTLSHFQLGKGCAEELRRAVM